jgi:trehalose 6-phosphate synthase/phosphatase
VAGRLLIVSNRLPITIRIREGNLGLVPSAGGLATGLRTFHESSQGLWIGWPGELSRLSTQQRAEVGRQLEASRIVPVPLTTDEVKSYYEGFANGVIWPLFHYMLDSIPLDQREWGAYRAANERFADVVARRYQPGDAIWVHDYQLMLVPGMLRERVPDARIGFFLHIPFPSFEVFRTLPWRQEILRGLLGADLIGFHTFSYVRYFTRALRHILSLEPQVDRIVLNGRDVRFRAFPMGIDASRFEQLAGDPRVQQELDAVREAADGRRIVLGIDRLDYTKGIPRRLLAFQRFLERDPSLRDAVRLIQVAVPSRVGVEPYKAFRCRLDELVGRINGVLSTPKSMPIHYLYRSVPAHQLVALYRAADVMLVTALRDGMNLVAKEFVASRTDEDGVLVLSEFAGAAEELTEALMINPYDIDASADAIDRALRMPPAERSARMRALRQRVRARTVHGWAEAFLDELDRPAVPTRATSDETEPIPPEILVELLAAQEELVLLLDYDGTLVPLASLPDLARPDAELIAVLRDLSDAGLQLHLVSGRSREDLASWFGTLPITLWSEHGAWKREQGTEWTATIPVGREWMGPIRDILEQFAACTPGALIEEKQTSIAWHYRTADPEFGARQALELKLILVDALHNQTLDILEGSKVIEIRPRGINKARVVERILLGGAPPSAIVAIGDDRTDEEMFAAMPPGSTSVHVGPGQTVAGYRIADSAAVRTLLAGLAAARRESPNGRVIRR